MRKRPRSGGVAVAIAGVAVLALAACSGTRGGDGATPRDSRACRVLTESEVESFVGAPVRDGRPDEPGDAVRDTCRWGDADPAVPGHILSVTIEPAGSVGDLEAGEGDQTYELPELGEGAIGIQQAGGGVRVVFSVADVRADLTYDVVPVEALAGDAIDRLARLANRVRDRLANG